MKYINFNLKRYQISKFSTLSRHWNQNIVYLMNTEFLLLYFYVQKMSRILKMLTATCLCDQFFSAISK